MAKYRGLREAEYVRWLVKTGGGNCICKAQKFATDLVDYCFLRNSIIPWEEMCLLKYTPISNGTDADFGLQKLSKPTYIASKTYPKISTEI